MSWMSDSNHNIMGQQLCLTTSWASEFDATGQWLWHQGPATSTSRFSDFDLTDQRLYVTGQRPWRHGQRLSRYGQRLWCHGSATLTSRIGDSDSDSRRATTLRTAVADRRRQQRAIVSEGRHRGRALYNDPSPDRRTPRPPHWHDNRHAGDMTTPQVCAYLMSAPGRTLRHCVGGRLAAPPTGRLARRRREPHEQWTQLGDDPRGHTERYPTAMAQRWHQDSHAAL